jgi:hypothetical protein
MSRYHDDFRYHDFYHDSHGSQWSWLKLFGTVCKFRHNEKSPDSTIWDYLGLFIGGEGGILNTLKIKHLKNNIHDFQLLRAILLFQRPLNNFNPVARTI